MINSNILVWLISFCLSFDKTNYDFMITIILTEWKIILKDAVTATFARKYKASGRLTRY